VDNNTAPELRNAILNIVESYHSNSEPAIIDQNYPHMNEILRDQNKIGWHNFIHGKWSNKWVAQQREFLLKHDSKRSCKRWATAIIHKMFMVSWDMWEHRNGILHTASSYHYQQKRRSLDQNIKQEYRKGTHRLSQDDRKLLDKPLIEVLRLSNDDKQLWLDSMHWARENFIAPEDRAQQQLQRQRGAMLNWLNTGSC